MPTPLATSLRFDAFELWPEQRLLLMDGQKLTLGSRAFDLLVCLVRHSERMLSKDELMALVWPGLVVEESNLTVQISHLRKLLGADAIITVQGRGYRFGRQLRTPGIPIAQASRPTSASAERSPSTPITTPLVRTTQRASIAVLPFINMSGDPQQDYFADGMVEDITTTLARMNAFLVIARSSSFVYKGRAVDIRQVGLELGVQYVLEGSVRKHGSQVRMTGQLIDAQSGNHLWADHFDGDIEQVFELQDQVTQAIVTALEPPMRRAAIERARVKPAHNLQAYDLILRALALLNPGTSQANSSQAMSFVRQALQLDPHYAKAKALGAILHLERIFEGLGGVGDIVAGLRYAEAALKDDDGDPITQCSAGVVIGSLGLRLLGYSVLGFKYEAGMAAIERALATSPNLMYVQHCAGVLKAIVGQTDAALAHFESAMRISPLDPDMATFIAGTSSAHLVGGQFALGLEAAERALAIKPDYVFALRLKMVNLGFLGRMDEARMVAQRMRVLTPNFTVSKYLVAVPYKSADMRKKCADIYLAAGMPK